MVSWKTVFRNVVANWASYVVTAVVGFLLAPLLLHRLGNTGYGLWTLVLSLTGYFGLLDLGRARFTTAREHMAGPARQHMDGLGDTGFFNQPDLVEAAARSGAPDIAAQAEAAFRA